MANRVDFYTTDYDDLIKQKGMKCDWEQAVVCQCISEDSGQPDFNCPLCNGSGFRFLPPKPIRVLATSFNSNVTVDTLSMREPGTAYITPPSSIIMGYHDRLIFTDFSCKYSETIRFQSGSVYSSRTYRNIKEILFLILDDNAYELGVDFRVSDDNYHIQWLDPTTFPEGSPVSLLYMTTPCYLVIDLLHELRATYIERKVPQETFKEFPKQYQVRRENFVYGVSDTPTVESPPATVTEEATYDY